MIIEEPDKFVFETRMMVAGLKKYLEVTEAQLQDAHALEMSALRTQGPASNSDEDHYMFRADEESLKDVFNRLLTPALRYSSTMLLHSAFETRLLEFCDHIKTVRQITEPFVPTNRRFLTIRDAETFLTEKVNFQVRLMRDWQPLMDRGKVRNCVAHKRGLLTGFKDEPTIRKIIAKPENGLSVVTDRGSDRLVVSRHFCDQYSTLIGAFFIDLFRCANISG